MRGERERDRGSVLLSRYAAVFEGRHVDTSCSFQRHDRFFDSVSVRHLFRKGQFLDIYPRSDSAASDIQVSMREARRNRSTPACRDRRRPASPRI